MFLVHPPFWVSWPVEWQFQKVVCGSLLEKSTDFLQNYHESQIKRNSKKWSYIFEIVAQKDIISKEVAAIASQSIAE